MAKLTHEELLLEIEKAKNAVEIGAYYLYYKEGKRYKVVDIAFDVAANEATIVYEAQYGENVHFTRVLSSWLEEIETEDGPIPRFTREY